MTSVAALETVVSLESGASGGQLKNAVTGQKLPSRREVAAQLQVNPNTVQKAFKLMEDEGYVRTSSTSGSVTRRL